MAMQPEGAVATARALAQQAEPGDGCFFYSRDRQKIALRRLDLTEAIATADDASRSLRLAGREDSSRVSSLITDAARAKFEMTDLGAARMSGMRRNRTKRVSVLPAAFEDAEDGRIRLIYKELVVRFRRKSPAALRRALLDKFGFRLRERNAFVPHQMIVTQDQPRHAGHDLVAVAATMADLDEIEFAAPNFVSEFRRHRAPRAEQWHLAGRTKGGVDAVGAWQALARPAPVVIAVLDDGVDLAHPDLKGRLVRQPDPREPRDICGRDFFVPFTSPDHFDPGPKRFKYPYDEMDGNDIHGTACAGVALADGRKRQRVFGAAPDARLLAVKIFHGDDLATDSRVADAIRYAARHAAVLSLSWGGPRSPDVEFALEDVQALRGGRGTVICAAAGNDGRSRVDAPASDPNCIAVGACTDADTRAEYSNYGPGLSVVAPSGGGRRDIFTTDVSLPNRGFNTGNKARGDAAGLYTNDFSGTSSATPLAAGVAALVLAARADLDRVAVKELLERTADRIGGVAYGPDGTHREYGHGRINAAAALAAVGARAPGSRRIKARRPR